MTLLWKKTDCFKFLGLFIDSKLTWTNHVDHLCKLIARNIGVINRIKYFIPSAILTSLYNTLILSYLSNGILAWGACSSSNLNRLLLLQKRALRIINFTDFDAHTDPLFLKHKTLKVKDIYFHQLGSLMYQSIFGTLQTTRLLIRFLSGILMFTVTLADKSLIFHLPQIRTSLTKTNNIKYEGPRLWNSFTEHLKSSKNLSVFKHNLKLTLLNNYPNSNF